MVREPIRITREELHRLVWSKTMRRVAEELGTSHLELVKACTAMDVPRPVSGQWKSLLLGQAVEQVPLPEARTGVAVEFLLRPVGTVSEEELPPLPETPGAEEAEAVKAETGGEIVETAVEPIRNRTAVVVTRQLTLERHVLRNRNGLEKQRTSKRQTRIHLRHSTAMQMLQSEDAPEVIAQLWLPSTRGDMGAINE